MLNCWQFTIVPPFQANTRTRKVRPSVSIVQREVTPANPDPPNARNARPELSSLKSVAVNVRIAQLGLPAPKTDTVAKNAPRGHSPANPKAQFALSARPGNINRHRGKINVTNANRVIIPKRVGHNAINAPWDTLKCKPASPSAINAHRGNSRPKRRLRSVSFAK